MRHEIHEQLLAGWLFARKIVAEDPKAQIARPMRQLLKKLTLPQHPSVGDQAESESESDGWSNRELEIQSDFGESPPPSDNEQHDEMSNGTSDTDIDTSAVPRPHQSGERRSSSMPPPPPKQVNKRRRNSMEDEGKGAGKGASSDANDLWGSDDDNSGAPSDAELKASGRSRSNKDSKASVASESHLMPTAYVLHWRTGKRIGSLKVAEKNHNVIATCFKCKARIIKRCAPLTRKGELVKGHSQGRPMASHIGWLHLKCRGASHRSCWHPR